MTGVLIAETEADLTDRVRTHAGADSASSGADGEAWLAERQERWIMGTPDEAGERRPRLRGRRACSGSCSRTSCPRDLDTFA